MASSHHSLQVFDHTLTVELKAPPLVFQVMLGMVRAHGVDDRVGRRADEAALLVLGATEVVGGHRPGGELVGDWVEADGLSVPS